MSHDHPGWEYRLCEVEAVGSLTADTLNTLGAEGWELVTIDQGQAILKRPRPDLREIVTADQRAHVYAARNAGGDA